MTRPLVLNPKITKQPHNIAEAQKLTKLGHFFQLLKDDSWHNINELSNTLKVPPNHMSEVLKLLNKHNLIEYKQDPEEAKINPEWKFICQDTTHPNKKKP